jgi:uncharacterized protein (DUF58 family)
LGFAAFQSEIRNPKWDRDDRMPPNTGLNSRYLRVADLRRMKNLFFSSRRVVEGQYSGRHASPLRGHSVEFNDYRPYMPGDEIGDIDWKVYGRTDKLFVKLFEHQSDMTVNLLVDASASMAYAGEDGSRTKYDHACLMAAAIAFLTTQQQDRVSFGLAQGGLHDFARPYSSMGHLVSILRTMEGGRPQGRSELAEALRKMLGMISRRGLLVVFSDLLDESTDIFSAIDGFTHRGGEVILFHVLHADELKLPAAREALFQDSETGQKISLSVEDIRQSYEVRLRQFLGLWSSGCRGRGIDYKLVSTANDYSRALEQYLYQRASMV